MTPPERDASQPDLPLDPAERRRSGRRQRARDRLMDRAHAEVPLHRALQSVRNVENLVLLVDDDLRETALALTHIEEYLTRTLNLLEMPGLQREHVEAVASDDSVAGHLDQLTETVESLRRRLQTLCDSMR